MSTRPPPPVAVVVRFIDCINRGDAASLGRLMTHDHELIVFDEPPLTGKRENLEAWRGYFANFAAYVIHPQRMAERGDLVAVLGHTTGSHLGLPDEVERDSTLIWLAAVTDGLIRSWRLVEDTPETRTSTGLDAVRD